MTQQKLHGRTEIEYTPVFHLKTKLLK